MRKFTIYAATSVTVLTMLAACGGGGGDAPASAPPPVAAAADKYVGTWGTCGPVVAATNGVVSARTEYTFTKTSATGLNVSLGGSGFTAANCTGPVFNTIPAIATGTIMLNGTKGVGANIVDKLDLNLISTTAALNGAFKDIGFVSGTTLVFGTTSAADAQGYPTVLDSVYVFNKM